MASENTLDDAINAAMGDTPESEVKDEPVVEEVPAADGTEPEVKTTEEIIEEALSAPDKWSGFSKTKFSMLPKEVQKELTDYHKSVEAQQKVYNALDETIGENKQAVIASYGSVENMFKHYMQLDQFAAKDPAGLVKWFLQQRGIDPQSIFGQQPAPVQQDPAANGAPVFDPAEIETTVKQQVDSALAIQRAQQMITDFEKNTEKYPFFNDVRTVMGQLITSGQASDMDSAYKKAIRLNDDIFAQVQAQENLKKTQIQQQSTLKAKQAATVKPAAGLSSNRKANGADLDSIIQEAMAVRV